MTHTSVLYRLQSIDSEADARRARLDEINALLGQNQEVRAARERLNAAQAQMRAAQTRASELELEIASLEDKAKAASERLYSGAVTNPKELQDMEQELHSLDRRRAALEDSLLEAMVAVEDAQSRAAQASSELETIEDRWAASQGDLAAEKRELEARLLELDADRQGVLEQVDAGALAAYEQLRARLGGLAVAKVQNGACAACGVAPASSVIQKARHQQLDARCPSCGRILYAA